MPTAESVPELREAAVALVSKAGWTDWFIRVPFWLLGAFLASVQVLGFRYFVTADAVAYMDMSDGVMPGFSWHHLITGVWSPLYPALIGVARRIFHPSPGNEIFFDHILSLPIFFFAFACFDVLLCTILARAPYRDSAGRLPLPRPILLALGCSLFLWTSLTQITLQSLRPDMLMSAFLYLALALVLRMRTHPPSWYEYAAVGVVLGIGFLAKAPMLPIGIVVLGCSVVALQDWRRRVPMALVSCAILLAIGSLYFVPLSLELHRFTLGESSRFNYLAHVDHALSDWYGGDAMARFGVPLHRSRKIFDSPPAYAFSIPVQTTHPLRFDPSYWTQGLKPRFQVRAQLSALAANLRVWRSMLPMLDIVIIGTMLLLLLSGEDALREVAGQFPLLLVGTSGMSMYALVHMEERYVGAFLLLVCLGFLAGVAFRRKARAVALGISFAMLGGVLLLLAFEARHDYRHPHDRNQEAVVAATLPQFGVQPGDPVARISSSPDLGWARAARVTIVSEVDWESGARNFWTDSPQVQQQVLAALAHSGAKAVIGRLMGRAAPPGWQRLGDSDYWVRPLTQQGGD